DAERVALKVVDVLVVCVADGVGEGPAGALVDHIARLVALAGPTPVYGRQLGRTPELIEIDNSMAVDRQMDQIGPLGRSIRKARRPGQLKAYRFPAHGGTLA